MEDGDDLEFPMFARLSVEDILNLATEAAFEAYAEERIPHHTKHGNAEDWRLTPVVMSISEMKALLDFFRPIAKDGKIPDMLCPLLSEIAKTLAENMTFMPMRNSANGDPRLN